MVEMHTSATSFDQRHQMPSASEELDSTKTVVFAARLLFCVAGDASMCQLWRGRSWVVGGPTQYINPHSFQDLGNAFPPSTKGCERLAFLSSTVCLWYCTALLRFFSTASAETPSFFEIRGCSKALRSSEASLTSDSTSATSTVLSKLSSLEFFLKLVLLQDLHSIHNRFHEHFVRTSSSFPIDIKTTMFHKSINDLHVRRLWSLIYKHKCTQEDVRVPEPTAAQDMNPATTNCQHHQCPFANFQAGGSLQHGSGLPLTPDHHTKFHDTLA